MENKKIFTPQEANLRLPLVKKIVSDIHTKAERFRLIMAKIKDNKISGDALELQAEVEGLISELEDLGCYYKDWDFKIGLVDFPAIIEERQALLCWRSDEPKIVWYHSYEEGFPGRKLIPSIYL
jgi:hypothetical protein